MERKIGETFEYEGHKLMVVVDDRCKCGKCFFCNKDCSSIKDIRGFCSEGCRTDKKNVIFIEYNDEQPQEQAEQPQKLNLCEILKDCPKGEMFWSPVFGDVWFYDIDQLTKRVKVRTSGVGSWYINADGTITIDKVTSPEIMLYPSRKQRDWSKFTAPWLKKERFDPKTLKAFDRVIVKNIQNNIWHIQYFSHINEKSTTYPFFCLHDSYAYCIPYNDDTKHLIGTTEEAPEFYKYWED